MGGARAGTESAPEVPVGRQILRRICSEPGAGREWGQARQFDVRFVALGESDYPRCLQGIYDPPPILAIGGNLCCLWSSDRRDRRRAQCHRQSASSSREKLARDLEELNSRSIVLARASCGGSPGDATTGHDRRPRRNACIYPHEHEPLAAQIVEHGALISEMRSPGSRARKEDFPRRNRLISGTGIGCSRGELAGRLSRHGNAMVWLVS